jgi:carboxypeptidase C (cathepsin A)
MCFHKSKISTLAFLLGCASAIAAPPVVQQNQNEQAGTQKMAVLPSNGAVALADGIAAPFDETAEFLKNAPKDNVLTDSIGYDPGPFSRLPMKSVNGKWSAPATQAAYEVQSVKRHTIDIGGKTVPYVASAGHLIAYTPADRAGNQVPQASIFYMAYTRNGLPREKRPVTFFWNGGPGSSSFWLHMGSWAPKRLVSDAPQMAQGNKSNDYKAEKFPLIDNLETLLDQTDLVFVDPVGTGLSEAIEPRINADFWGVTADAKLMRDFITSYVNKYGRQSSPKYLYGESYGGIRTPIVANLLEKAGTANFKEDPSGAPAVVLSGFVLNSPILDYGSNCDPAMGKGRSCGGVIPGYAMTADFFKQSSFRVAGTSSEDYGKKLRAFVENEYVPTLERYNDAKKWKPFAKTAAGREFVRKLASMTGIKAEVWSENPVRDTRYFRSALKPAHVLGRYDGRMIVPESGIPGLFGDLLGIVGLIKKYAADDYIDNAYLKGLQRLLPEFLNYKVKAPYQKDNRWALIFWNWSQSDQPGYTFTLWNRVQSLSDFKSAYVYDPNLKFLVLAGNEDLATPAYQAELDLKNAGLNTARNPERVPVKTFEGGHMTYNTEGSRIPMKRALDAFYQAPPYNSPVAKSPPAVSLK